jgi:hypothetical protein
VAGPAALQGGGTITMMRTLKSGLTIGMLVAALAMTGGCGDNDNSGNGNDNGAPRPTRTATPGAPVATATPTTAATNPGPTATPGATTQNVGFNFTAANGIQAFQVRAAYPTAKGSFTGTAENVSCTITGGGGIFTKNDNDTGTLTLSVANTANLTFPIDVACTFDATSAITSSDITVTVQEVTQNNAPGNTADLTVAVTVS